MAKRKEKRIVVCRKHWTVFLWNGILAAVLVAFGLSMINDPEMKAGISACIIMFLPALLLIVSAFITYKTDYIALTETRIIGHKGFIRSRKISAPLSKVQNIEIGNGLFGKIFNYHTLIIDNAGTAGKEFRFTRATNAERFMEKAYDLIDEY